jgi:hypothetical protein
VRFRWFTVLAATTALVGVGAQAASAKVPAQQLSRFKAIEVPFGTADSKWTNALEALSPKSSAAQVSKPCLAFVPALKTFDTALLKVGFTGKAAADANTIVSLNKQMITIMSSIRSVKTFETEFSALSPKYLSVQESFAKDIGVPAGDVII